MAKRGTRYIYDTGEIWRLTDRQYCQFLAASKHRPTSVSQYGRYVGSAFNITRATPADFEEELKVVREAAAKTAKEENS